MDGVICGYHVGHQEMISENLVASTEAPSSRRALDDYASRGSKKIGGWLSRIDAEIMSCILTAQNGEKLGGAVAEIGVHHGKAFILLCLGLKAGEKAYCIDIFDDQHLNKDNSGKGDRTILEMNLVKSGVSLEQVVIDARSSELVKPDELLAQVGPVRLFSVDGGHWLDIVANDLRLAEATVASHGVIALDDFHRPEWPDVSAGYFRWFVERKKPILPFAIGFNKLYLCSEEYVSFYQKAMLKNPIIESLRTKTCEFQGVTLPVYEARVLPEHKLKDRCKAYLRIFHPEKVASAKRLLGMSDGR
jgi:hypothetical protein